MVTGTVFNNRVIITDSEKSSNYLTGMFHRVTAQSQQGQFCSAVDFVFSTVDPNFLYSIISPGPQANCNQTLSMAYLCWGVDDACISAKLLQNFGCHWTQVPQACMQHRTFIFCWMFMMLVHVDNQDNHTNSLKAENCSDLAIHTIITCLRVLKRQYMIL